MDYSYLIVTRISVSSTNDQYGYCVCCFVPQTLLVPSCVHLELLSVFIARYLVNVGDMNFWQSIASYTLLIIWLNHSY